MSSLTALARDDHSARTLLALLSAPNDKVTGQLLANFGAVEVVRLIESDVNVPGMNKVEAAIQASCETRLLVGQQAQAFTAAALPLCRSV